MLLSEHYSLQELTVYPPEFETLEGFTNVPDGKAVRNLERVCKVLEVLYERFGKLEVLCGYRSFEFDAAVCGIDEPSNHIYGTCVDIKVRKKTASLLKAVLMGRGDVKEVKECKRGNKKWLHVEVT